MLFTTILTLVATPVLLVTAALDPATSNTKGYKAKNLNCGGKPHPQPNKSVHPSIPFQSIPSPLSLQPQKSPHQFEPPNAPTIHASPEPKPSPSSKQTTNPTRTTALHTEHAARTRVLRQHLLTSRLTPIVGCFIGGMRSWE